MREHSLHGLRPGEESVGRFEGREGVGEGEGRGEKGEARRVRRHAISAVGKGFCIDSVVMNVSRQPAEAI